MIPLLIGILLLLLSVALHGVAGIAVVRVLMRLDDGRSRRPGFRQSVLVMELTLLVLMVSHLGQVAIWAMTFVLAGELPDFDTAFYFSLVNYTTLGYGDIVLSDEWRLLGPLEAATGVLTIGLSTAILFAVARQLMRAGRAGRGR